MSDTLRDRVTIALGDAYDVGIEIGRGGMGVVYRATDRKLRRQVAIKVLPPELAYRDDVRQRFLREAQTAAQLSHPNIVPIFAVEEREGLVCFVMSLVEGESLATRISRDRRLPFEDVRSILMAVADALGYAHSRGIVHRDVKPDNILIDRSGRPMVTDFGIARAAEGDARLTLTGIAVGTPAYMSPEQGMGDREIDGRSDLYSLAVVGYQMLSGELPFQAGNTPAMLMKHISEAPRPLLELRADVPSWLLHVLEKSLAKKPDDRFATAAEFCRALADRQDAGRGRQAPVADGQPGVASDRLSSAWKHSVAPRSAVDAARAGRHEERAIDRLQRSARERGGARDAVDAANAGWRPGLQGNPQALRKYGPEGSARRDLAPVPPWMPPSWRDARSQWRHVGRGGEPYAPLAGLPVSEKIRRFRRQSASAAITVGMLAAINIAFSPDFLWFLFPMAGLSIGLLHRAGSLWAEGIRLKDVFGREARDRLQERSEQEQLLAGPSPAVYAEKLAPRDVLAGPHGAVVRRAATDRQTIHEAVSKLTKADRDLIPDVLPTVDALAERVGSVAQSLHRLDEDVQPGVVEELGQRIEAARALPESRDRDHKVQLLERQLSTIKDLASRRDTLVSQLESASLMLQSMRIDLIALRSAGVQSVLNDVGSATQEARALSREIANALDAARQVR
ncbi:MAG: protein kinase [Gemmatimonadaceae bacterium]|nr:protein kinase [Gemmatimonadaceae bacterium]